MVNWKVRLKNPSFWVGVVGALGTCATAIAQALGYQIDVGVYTNALTMLIAGVFAVLALFGVVSDPTTEGVTDSAQALSYSKPADNAAKTIASISDGNKNHAGE